MPNVKCCLCSKFFKPNRRRIKNPCWQQGCDADTKHYCCGACEMQTRRSLPTKSTECSSPPQDIMPSIDEIEVNYNLLADSEIETFVENSFDSQIEKMLLSPLAGKKRGRPAKNPKDLHPDTIRRKFKEDAQKIQQSIVELNKKSNDYEWGLELQATGKIVKGNKPIELFSTEPQESVEELNAMVKRLAFIKLK